MFELASVSVFTGASSRKVSAELGFVVHWDVELLTDLNLSVSKRALF